MAQLHEDISNAELERRTGVARGNLWMVAKGEKGLSLDASRAVSKSTGRNQPITLYLQTQRRAAKHKAESGEEAAALRAVAAVVDNLKTIPEDQLALEATDIGKAIEELSALLDEVFGNATPAGGSKPAEKTRPKRDALGRRVPEDSGDHERDGHGRKMRS